MLQHRANSTITRRLGRAAQQAAWRVLAAWVLAVLAPLLAQPQAVSPEQEIRQVIAGQAEAWNRGDLHAFMSAYEDSPETTFVSDRVIHGYQHVLDRYLNKYSSTEQMGTAAFSDLEIRMLGGNHAAVVGRWNLTRPQAAGGPAGGIFTLVLRRTPEGWKIILDHTS